MLPALVLFPFLYFDFYIIKSQIIRNGAKILVFKYLM
nr:MAG TPA: hypothetical protein [Caudoviricetes sp.]